MENTKLIILYLISVILTKANMYEFSCNIYEDCSAGYTEIPDPDDCQRYYTCLADETPSEESYACEEGSYFDITVESPECSSNYAYCPQKCYPTPLPGDFCNTESTRGAATAIPPIDPQNSYNPENCTKYFKHAITYDEVIPEDCAPGTYFNGASCVYSEHSCCPELCVPNCPRPYSSNGLDQFVPDPINCDGYYECTKKGPVYQSCGENEIFYAPLAKCITNAYPDIDLTDNPDCLIYCPSQVNITLNPKCITELECTEPGSFPVCNNCTKQYFYCSKDSGKASTRDCPENLFFNPNTGYCSPEETCEVN